MYYVLFEFFSNKVMTSSHVNFHNTSKKLFLQFLQSKTVHSDINR